MFNKMGYKERQTDTGMYNNTSLGKLCTSRCQLGALAGATIIVSVLGAEWCASVGEAASPSSCAAEAFGMKAAFERAEKEFLQITQQQETSVFSETNKCSICKLNTR